MACARRNTRIISETRAKQSGVGPAYLFLTGACSDRFVMVPVSSIELRKPFTPVKSQAWGSGSKSLFCRIPPNARTHQGHSSVSLIFNILPVE